MKPVVYVVEVDDGQAYEDRHHWVEGVVVVKNDEDAKRARKIGEDKIASMKKDLPITFGDASYDITIWYPDGSNKLIENQEPK